MRRQESWDRNKIKKLLKKHKNSGDGSTIIGFRYNEFEKRHPKLFHAAVYHLTNGWGKAVSACGLDYDRIRKK